MKKIIFLGCENSHTATFLEYIRQDEKYSDIEVLGVYSHEVESAIKVSEKYGVPVMATYDEAVGKVDGVVITARHGERHYLYAKPYMQKGITMFIDKPITISEEEAVEFMRECRDVGVKITGGSCLRFEEWVCQLKADVATEVDGKTLGGFMRTPISLVNPHGGFYFYAQHLVESVQEVFGRYPKSVFAKRTTKAVNVTFNYEDYCVFGLYTDGNYKYYMSRSTVNGEKGKLFTVDENCPCFKVDWDEFYNILSGGEQVATYQDFIQPVFIMNAIVRSMESGREEIVKEYEV